MIRKKILGLDVSTSCTGVCILSHTGKIEYMGYIRTDKAKDPFDKLEKLVGELSSLVEKHIGDEEFIVCMEQALKKFRKGRSSADVIFKLAQFNGMAQLACHYHFGKKPIMILPNDARKAIGLKLSRKRGKDKRDTKEQVAEFVINKTGFEFKTKLLKSGPRKGMKVFDDKNYDACDAYVVAEAGRLQTLFEN